MLQTITFQQFYKLTSDEQLDYLISYFDNLTFKRKNLLIYFIGFASNFLSRNGVMTSLDSTYWAVYRFDMSLSELKEKAVEFYGYLFDLKNKIA